MKSYKLRIDVVRGLLKLSQESFMKLEDFLRDFDEFWTFVKQDNLDASFCNKFVECVRGDLKDSNNKYENLTKGVISRITFKKLYKDYEAFVSRNKDILRELLNSTAIDIFKYFNLEGYLSLYSYLSENYDKKDEYLSKLDALRNLGFGYFWYAPEDNLDKTEIIEIEDRENKYSGVGISGIFTDGNMEALVQEVDNSKYPVKLTGANYILRYFQNYVDELYETNFIILKNLDFDINTLPTYEDLFEKVTLPKIDFEKAEAKTSAVDSVLNICNYHYFTAALIQSMTNYLNQLNIASDCQEREEILRKVNEFKSILDDLEKLGFVVISDHIRRGVISEEEFIETEKMGRAKRLRQNLLIRLNNRFWKKD